MGREGVTDKGVGADKKGKDKERKEKTFCLLFAREFYERQNLTAPSTACPARSLIAGARPASALQM